MRLTYSLPILAAVAAILPAGAIRATELRVGVDEVIQQALAHNPEIQLAVQDYRIAEAESEASPVDLDWFTFVTPGYQSKSLLSNSTARSDSVEQRYGGSLGLKKKFGLGTSTELSFQLLRIRENLVQSTLPDRYQSAASFKLTQPLLRGLGFASNLSRVRQAEARLSRARHQLLETIDRTLISAQSLFWDLVASQKELEVRELAVRQSQENLEAMRALKRIGKKNGAELMSAEAQRSLAEAKLAVARSKLADTEEKLLREVLPPRLDSIDTAIRAQASSPKLDALRKSLNEPEPPSLASNRGRILEAELAEAEAALRASRNGLLPTLDLSLEVLTTGVSATARPALRSMVQLASPAWELMLAFRIPIPHRSARGDAWARTAAREAKERQVFQEKLGFESEVRSARRDLERSIETLTSLRGRLELSGEKLRAKERIFRVGRLSIREFQEEEALHHELMAAEWREVATLQKQLLRLEAARGSLAASQKARYLSALGIQ